MSSPSEYVRKRSIAFKEQRRANHLLLFQLLGEGYSFITQYELKGVCAIKRVNDCAYLFIDMQLDKDNTFLKRGYYYFDNVGEAFRAMKQWDGLGDPPGEWINYSGVCGIYNKPVHEEIEYDPDLNNFFILSEIAPHQIVLL